MPQEGAVSTDQVRNAVSSLVDRGKNMTANLSAVSSSVMTAAEYLSILGDSDKVATYRELMVSLGKLTHEVEANQNVLRRFGQTYQASLQIDTDFKAYLDEGLKDELERKPYDPRRDEQLREFASVVEDKDEGGAGPSGGGNGEEMELGEDEDLQIEEGGRRWTNDKCPLSMKPVMDIDKPYKDKLGYVYEHADVMNYLRHYPNGHKHPVAGVQMLLRAADLSPADEVTRAKRRQRLREMMGRGNANANDRPTQMDEDIVDV